MKSVINLLLIEDDLEDVLLLREMLSDANANITVHHADCLKNGLEMLHKQCVDIILLDLFLPDSCGLDTFQAIKLNSHIIPIVVLTGLDDEDSARLAIKAGAQDYLSKHTLNSSFLLRSISCAIDRNQLLIERKRVEVLLKESERRLRDFARAVPDISFIVDEDARIIEFFGVNKAVLPIPQKEFKGCMLHDSFFATLANELMEEIQQTLITQLPRCREYILESPSKKRFIEMRTAPMHYNINGKKTVAVVAIDTTELRRTERALQLTYEIQRRSDFFNDIISGISIIDERTKAFFNELGKDISMSLFCALLTCENFTGNLANTSDNQTELRVIKNRIIELLSDDPACIVWDCYDNIGILCHTRKQDAAGKQFGMGIAQRVKDKLYRYNPGLKVIIGIGNIQMGLGNLKKSYQQALNTVNAVRCQGVKEGIYHYQDLGILQLLATYTENEQADEFVQGTIGKLIAYDREKGTDFVIVLERILQTTSLKEAAAEMYVHHKTMAFRKKRIEKILGTSIDGFETRLSLVAAIKLHQLRTNTNE